MTKLIFNHDKYSGPWGAGYEVRSSGRGPPLLPGDLLLLTSPRCKELDEHSLPRSEFIIVCVGKLDGVSCGGGREAE